MSGGGSTQYHSTGPATGGHVGSSLAFVLLAVLGAFCCVGLMGCAAGRAYPADGRISGVPKPKGGVYRGCQNDILPDFPWPVPLPSARMALPESLLAQVRARRSPRLRDVADSLDAMFLSAGYSQRAYFQLQADDQTIGFALVTRMERIRVDGTPFPARERFVPAGAQDQFDILSFLKSLFVAPVGFYRVIVVVVSRAPVESSGERLTEAGADALLDAGGSRLAGCVARYPFTKDYAADALIYEFRHAPEESPSPTEASVTQLKPGLLDPGLHLKNAGLLPSP